MHVKYAHIDRCCIKSFTKPCVIHAREFQGYTMSILLWLTDEQMSRLQPYYPKSMAGRGLMIVVC